VAADPGEAAHRKAFADVVLPLTREALDLVDPLADVELGGPLRPPALGLAALERARATVDAAWTEASGVELARLEPADRRVLLALRFALSRARDRLGQRDPATSDPLWPLAELRQMLTAVADAAAAGTCDARGCLDALDEAASVVAALIDRLGGASALALDRAEARALELERDVRALAPRLPEPARPAATALADALVRHRSALAAAEAALPPAPERTWAEPVPSVRLDGRTLRLPERLGMDALRRMLEVEHDVEAHPMDLVETLGAAINRLTEMIAARPADTAPPRPLTAAACAEQLGRLRDALAAQPDLGVTEVADPCPTLLASAGPEPRTGAAWRAAIVHEAVTRPRLAAARAAVQPALARVRGGAADRVAATLVAVGIFEAAGWRDAARLVLERARDEACLAAAGLWVHAQLPQESTLREALTASCPARTPEAWIVEAEADPRGALMGLGYRVLQEPPDKAFALERLWWLPLGLIDELGRPLDAATDAPAPARAQVKVEEIEPGTPLPPLPPAE